MRTYKVSIERVRERERPPIADNVYERNMRQLVMPAFENYVLREITVRRLKADLLSPGAGGAFRGLARNRQP